MLDPVSDMLTRIRNAGMARHKTTTLPHSKLKVKIASILKDEGYISDFTEEGEGVKKILNLELKYDDKFSFAIKKMKRVSKSGCRVYSGVKDIPKINQGLGITILSTSKGIITDKEARQLSVGGELLCEIW
ncbi:MAG: 30S ribosomal protein S8 [Deltaproteobacteria bacterium]|nr:30S ribosomal protein S8 [Deltaproteobacteria bacterium]